MKAVIALLILCILGSVLAKEAPAGQIKYEIPNGILNRQTLIQIFGANLTQINLMDFYGSGISYIEPFTFTGLSNLSFLYLNGNRLTFIPNSKVFKSFHNFS
jgi:hypothetical protein